MVLGTSIPIDPALFYDTELPGKISLGRKKV